MRRNLNKRVNLFTEPNQSMLEYAWHSVIKGSPHDFSDMESWLEFCESDKLLYPPILIEDCCSICAVVWFSDRVERTANIHYAAGQIDGPIAVAKTIAKALIYVMSQDNIDVLYGVIPPDNVAALRVASFFGFKPYAYTTERVYLSKVLTLNGIESK